MHFKLEFVVKFLDLNCIFLQGNVHLLGYVQNNTSRTSEKYPSLLITA